MLIVDHRRRRRWWRKSFFLLLFSPNEWLVSIVIWEPCTRFVLTALTVSWTDFFFVFAKIRRKVRKLQFLVIVTGVSPRSRCTHYAKFLAPKWANPVHFNLQFGNELVDFFALFQIFANIHFGIAHIWRDSDSFASVSWSDVFIGGFSAHRVTQFIYGLFKIIGYFQFAVVIVPLPCLHLHSGIDLNFFYWLLQLIVLCYDSGVNKIRNAKNMPHGPQVHRHENNRSSNAIDRKSERTFSRLTTCTYSCITSVH